MAALGAVDMAALDAAVTVEALAADGAVGCAGRHVRRLKFVRLQAAVGVEEVLAGDVKPQGFDLDCHLLDRKPAHLLCSTRYFVQ